MFEVDRGARERGFIEVVHLRGSVESGCQKGGQLAIEYRIEERVLFGKLAGVAVPNFSKALQTCTRDQTEMSQVVLACALPLRADSVRAITEALSSEHM